jgi:predicted secreted protein
MLMSIRKDLEKLLEWGNQSGFKKVRFHDWQKKIQWIVNGKSYFWETTENGFHFTDSDSPDFVLKTSKDILDQIVQRKKPFFISIWGTGDIQFQGSFADAFRLGYIFLNDKRKRKVVFLSHCFLNINTRFPGGCAYPGATTPLIQTILECGVGIIQMPCPEYLCLGLEKYEYGKIEPEKLRKCFRKEAEKVVKQIKDYLEFEFEVLGIIGMNPSPSCGVEITKGKGTMLGIDRDTSEKEDSGVFIEELKKLMKKEKIENVPVFGVRRILPGERGIEERLEQIKNRLI